MDGSGLTTFALIFMLVSMGSVTLLTLYCFWRILTGDVEDGAATASGPEEGRGGGGAG